MTCLHSIDAAKDDIDLLADTRSRIDDLFLIVVVGEFNAGKSTFINGLIGSNLMKSGVLPTTAKICIVRHESDHTSSSTSKLLKRADNMLLDDVEEIEIPLQWLKHIAIVDTPGTNAIISKHEEITQKIIPRADLVLFVTSAERPMSGNIEEMFVWNYLYMLSYVCTYVYFVNICMYVCIYLYIFIHMFIYINI
jgi:ribosome biogenesis GTPase A